MASLHIHQISQYFQPLALPRLLQYEQLSSPNLMAVGGFWLDAIVSSQSSLEVRFCHLSEHSALLKLFNGLNVPSSANCFFPSSVLLYLVEVEQINSRLQLGIYFSNCR